MLKCSLNYLYSVELYLDSINEMILTDKNLWNNIYFTSYVGRAALNVFFIQRNDPDFYKEKNEEFGFDLIVSLYDEYRTTPLWPEINTYYDLFVEKFPSMRKLIHEYVLEYENIIYGEDLPFPKIEKWKDSRKETFHDDFLFENLEAILQGAILEESRRVKNVTDFEDFLERKKMGDFVNLEIE